MSASKLTLFNHNLVLSTLVLTFPNFVWSVQKLLLTFRKQELKVLTVVDKFHIVDETDSVFRLTLFNHATVLVRLELTVVRFA